jgi:membrane peptidoglycan carboxypeptidase
MRSRSRWLARRTYSLTVFVGVCLVAGALVAGFALPLVGGAALTAKAAAEDFQSLPGDLKTRELAQRSVVLAADGTRIATFFDENRVTVALSAVAPVMRQAILAIEDARFYEHPGIDIRGTTRALISNTSGGPRQGGSTLTQQYVKNLLIELADGDKKKIAAARAPTVTRKLQELKYALEIEKRMTKDQILQNYLNISYFGSGAYGVEAAARHYFSTSAAKLTLPQAAMLAGVIRSPSAYDPTLYPQRAKARRDIVLGRMREVGYITPAQHAKAVASKLGLKVSETRNGCTRSPAPFFCDYVVRVIQNDPIFGRTQAERADLLSRGGLTIRTTLDLKAQKAADRALREYVEPKNRVASALAMVEPGTGRIKAIGVNRLYGKGRGRTNVNYATDYAYGGSRGFQVGSTMKAFTGAAAIEERFGVYYPIFSPYHLTQGLPRTKDCRGRNVYDNNYAPYNEGPHENGLYDMRTAMALSVNTYFLQLQNRVGLCDVVTMAKRLGVKRADGRELDPVLSFTLGVNELSPLTMAASFATFAARGTYCNPVAILSIKNRRGKSLEVPDAKCKEVLQPEVADVMTSLFQGVMRNGTGSRLNLGRPAAGKTGTTNGRVAVWFVGYTPQLTTAVWAGNPDNSRYKLRNIRVGDRYYGNVCGGCLPGPIWEMAMRGALRGVPEKGFPGPRQSWLNGRYAPPPPTQPGQTINPRPSRGQPPAFFRFPFGPPPPRR